MPDAPRFGPVHVVGIGCTPLSSEQDAMLDELVFDALSGALRECGLRKQDLGLSVQASMDVYDGRSISSGLITAAAGGYLNDSYRIEGDAGSAIIAAAQAVAAGDVEVAAAVAVFNPETTADDDAIRTAFLQKLSSLAFDPLFDRPVGMTAHAAWGMQAAAAVESGAITVEALAQRAADQITRGSTSPRALRPASSPAQVLDSPLVAWPLHELMLPTVGSGSVAVVLASPARASRLLGRSAAITGVGHATGDYTWSGEWLREPGATTARAAAMAYPAAGVTFPVEQTDTVHHSAATPALDDAILAALGFDGFPAERVNPTGGVLSSYAGLLNGGLRLLDAVETLDRLGTGRAVVHSTDTVTGPVSEDVTVLVLDGV